MSIYKGQLPDKAVNLEAEMQVTVDGQPLPPAEAEVPGAGQTFGWGIYSTYRGKKLLSYSLLLHEMHRVMGLPRPTAHKYIIELGDFFMDDQVAKFDRQWSMTSEEIGKWIKQKFPKTWDEVSSHHARA